MSLTASPDAPVVRGDARVEVLFGELSELAGQRNAIDGRIVEIVAEMDRDELCGATGARSVLVVQDMASGRQLERVTSKYALTGLVATPDGATLLALASQPREPETGELVAGWPVVPDDEQVLQVKLPDAELRSAVRFSFGRQTTDAEVDDAAGRVVAVVTRLRSLPAE